MTTLKQITVLEILLVVVVSSDTYDGNTEVEWGKIMQMEDSENITTTANETDGAEFVQAEQMWDETERQDMTFNGLSFLTSPPFVAELKKLLSCDDQQLRTIRMRYGAYWLMQNIIQGEVSRFVSCAETITYTTHGDYTFVKHLLPLVERWRAPISFALFAPGHDLYATMDAIQYVRHCVRESALIRRFVTFHIYFPRKHMPGYVPIDEEDAENWSYNCLSDDVPIGNIGTKQIYRYIHNLTYPINVGRNIARQAVNTHFILASDIELFPSPGLAQQFLELIWRNRSIYFEREPSERVYPLPVYELQKKAQIPNNKSQLVQLLRTGEAKTFHEKICKKCHQIPREKAWQQAKDATLSIFAKAKREQNYAHWEPFYISDNREPMFDERVTWEGQSNKRIQAYAMCLLRYEFHVLYPAFLVHAPGIKHFDGKAKRSGFVLAANKFINQKILPEYRILYGNNKLCVV